MISVGLRRGGGREGHEVKNTLLDNARLSITPDEKEKLIGKQ